jgi:hypothetical protein
MMPVAGRYVVGDDPVAALALALGAGICDHLLGLRCKAGDEARPQQFAPRDGAMSLMKLKLSLS